MSVLKRTNSSESPRPAKTAKMALKRTQSLLFLPTPDPTPSSVPHSAFAYYKEQRQRRKHHPEQLTIRIHSPKRMPSPKPKPKSSPPPPPIPTRGRTRTPIAPSKVILPSISSPVTTVLTPRQSSPLAPTRVPLPGRPVFPRSKRPEPDLYRMAIRMRMLLSPEGQKILSLGPRVALEMDVDRVNGVKQEAERTRRDIVSVTRDLERMVQDISDEDVLMDCLPTPLPTPAPPILTTSWVIVKGEDWEMVDCTA